MPLDLLRPDDSTYKCWRSLSSSQDFLEMLLVAVRGGDVLRLLVDVEVSRPGLVPRFKTELSGENN